MPDRRNIYQIMVKVLFAVLSVCGLCTSCIEENPSFANRKYLSLSINLPTTTGTSTRAITEAMENTVREIDVLLFDATTSLFVERIEAQNLTTTGNKTRFDVILPGGTYDMVILGNCREEIIGIAPVTTETKSALSNRLFKQLEYWGISEATFTFFPIWGELKNTLISDALDGTVIPALRMAARIDVSLSNQFYNASTSNRLMSVRLYNRYKAGRIIPDDGIIFLNSDPYFSISTPSLPASTYRELSPVLYNVDTPNKELRMTIYTFEAPTGSYSRMLENTCLVIGIGTERETSGGATRASIANSTHYYRIDFMEDQEDQSSYMPLLRNHCYEVEINTVAIYGFKDPEQAFYSEKFPGISYTVTPYKMHQVDGGTVTPFHLFISKTSLSFTFPGGDEDITVYTDHPDGFTYHLSTSGTSIVGEATAAGFITVTPDNNTTIPGNEITLHISASPGSFIYYLHIKAGNLTNVVKISQ